MPTEKKILIDEEGPFLETKTNDYTVYRRRLDEDELAAFKARQKENISTVIAEAEEEGSPEAPPILPPADSEETKEEAPKRTTRKKRSPRSAPEAPSEG